MSHNASDAISGVPLTVVTASIIATGSEDINVAASAGLTNDGTIVVAAIRRTAGTSTSVAVGLFEDVARTSTQRPLFGDPTIGTGITIGTAFVGGPQPELSASFLFMAVPYHNSDGDRRLFLRVRNTDISNAGTFELRLVAIPIPLDLS